VQFSITDTDGNPLDGEFPENGDALDLPSGAGGPGGHPCRP